ncbi:MAG: hypothetical protein IJ880_08010 [Bacilli bacterium]|nr:hypothetical protein [Bacilli bacterium]
MATWEDITKKVQQNKIARISKEKQEVVVAYRDFLDNLMKRVEENHEVFAPSDVFTYKTDGYFLQESIQDLKDLGFEYNNTDTTFIGYPSAVRI